MRPILSRNARARTGAPGPALGRGRALAVQAVGTYFAAGAVFNAVRILPDARVALIGFRDESWLPPYRSVLAVLIPVAPAVIAAVVVFEAVVAYHLLRCRRVGGALRWAQAWVLGLIPALGWPYWVPNALSAVAFEGIRRSSVGAPHRCTGGLPSGPGRG